MKHPTRQPVLNYLASPQHRGTPRREGLILWIALFMLIHVGAQAYFCWWSHSRITVPLARAGYHIGFACPAWLPAIVSLNALKTVPSCGPIVLLLPIALAGIGSLLARIPTPT